MIIKKNLMIHKYLNAYAIVGEQGIIHVYDSDKKYVEYTSKRKVGANYYKTPTISSEDINGDYCEEEVVYIGFCRGHWGHFMVDSSIRMWALLDEECIGKKILVNIEGMRDFYYKWFKYFNIDKKNIIELDSNKQYKKILVPDLSYVIDKYISVEFSKPFEYIASEINIDLPVYSKIYLSRVHFSHKNKMKQIGEKNIQNIFEKNGYKIIYPEEISFEEQVWYYSHCDSMVTTNGTVAHNILFMRDDSELIILNRFYEESMHQNNINLVKNVRVTNINAYYKSSTHDNALMVMSEELKEFFKKRNFFVPMLNGSIKNYIIYKLPYFYKWL